jgi:hypothetical protein
VPEKLRGYDPSIWILLARRTGDLGKLRFDPRWRACRPDPSQRTWTDDYSNPLAVVDWG